MDDLDLYFADWIQHSLTWYRVQVYADSVNIFILAVAHTLATADFCDLYQNLLNAQVGHDGPWDFSCIRSNYANKI